MLNSNSFKSGKQGNENIFSQKNVFIPVSKGWYFEPKESQKKKLLSL